MFDVHENPFRGLAESILTSNPLDYRDADSVSLSYQTTSGTSSVFTYLVSNYSGVPDNIPATSWSHFTLVIPPSGVSTMVPPLEYRYGAIKRPASGASWQFDWVKTVRV